MKPIIFQLIFAVMLSGCFNKQIKQEPETKKSTSNLTKARIKTVHGDIIFTFFPKEAPNTVARIKQLISENFYNGLTFHRVIPGFVIQGGDPRGNGTGGSGKNLKAEFNKLKHTPGILAMARSQDVDSADSQFYISLGTHPHLDGKYTIFGKVIEGLDVATKVAPNDKMISITLEE